MDAILARSGLWLVVGIVTLSLGCAESKSDRPKTYPVSGTVSYNGAPVADANLNFQHADGNHFSMAKTDASGNYKLMTFEPGDGAVPGEYKVGISKYEQLASAASTSEEDYVPPDDNAPAPVAKNLLPAKYAIPANSTLVATVKEEPNTVNFELTD